MLKDIGKIKVLVSTQRPMELAALQCYPVICVVLPLFSKFPYLRLTVNLRVNKASRPYTMDVYSHILSR